MYGFGQSYVQQFPCWRHCIYRFTVNTYLYMVLANPTHSNFPAGDTVYIGLLLIRTMYGFGQPYCEQILCECVCVQLPWLWFNGWTSQDHRRGRTRICTPMLREGMRTINMWGKSCVRLLCGV